MHMLLIIDKSLSKACDTQQIRTEMSVSYKKIHV